MITPDVLCTDFGGVGGGVEQTVDVGHVGGLDLDNPAFAIWVVVDGGSLFEGFVELNHFAGDGHEQVGNSLHGLEAAKGSAAVDSVAHAVDIDKNDVAELVLGVVGDTNIGKFAFNAYPFVVLGVL